MAYEDLAPNYAIVIGGNELGKGVTEFVQSVEYESCDGLADEAKVIFSNPDFALTDAKFAQAGNEMSLWMGYGNELKHVGRVYIVRVIPTFPQDQMPTVEIQGYTTDARMMDNSPEKGDERRWKDVKFSQVVEEKASYYQMDPDVDETPEDPRALMQKAGLSDFDVVQGLANITGFFFWVDGDQDGKWTLHFKHPDKVLTDTDQPNYTFRYNQGDESTLLQFRPEMLIKGATTKLKVQVKNTRTGKVMGTVLEEDNIAPDVQYEGNAEDKVQDSIPQPTTIKVYLNDYSFDVVANRKFEKAVDVELWAKQWFQRNKDRFVLASGTVIGSEKLMARQVHTLEGLSKVYDGDYYFSRVRHILEPGSGYRCEFNCRKQS